MGHSWSELSRALGRIRAGADYRRPPSRDPEAYARRNAAARSLARLEEVARRCLLPQALILLGGVLPRRSRDPAHGSRGRT